MLGARYGVCHCMVSLDDSSIGCDSCNSRNHPIHVSLGLSNSIINSIKEYGGKGINFVVLLVDWKGEVVVMGHSLSVLLMAVEVWLVMSVSRL